MMGVPSYRGVIDLQAASGSSFTDDFNRANEDLETSADWTRVGGSAGDIDVATNMALCRTTASSGGIYQCPDQGAGDKYVEGVISTGGFFPLAMRLTDNANWIAVRHSGGQYQAFKRVAGSFTALGSYTAAAGSLVRIEMVGNDFDVFIAGVSRITFTDSFNSAETRQGMVARSTANFMLDDFGAGTL